jgi:ergothioneine biosynthesis protein EgtB
MTEQLCAPLTIEDHVVQPEEFVSPPKWHLGHTSWFFETFILKNYGKNYKPFNEVYPYVFNSYYESIGDRVLRKRRGTLSRPSVEEVYKYRKHVNDLMPEIIASVTENELQKFSFLLELGLQHEQQHQELLVTDIKYIFFCSPFKPAYQKLTQSANAAPIKSEYIKIAGGMHEIGYRGKDFCFDNEIPAHKVYVDDFTIRNTPITNGEYLAFMEDGGYKRFDLWLADGWDIVQRLGWQSPLYWEKMNGAWNEFTLAGMQKVDPNLPVCHISFYEADAFAKWSNERLLTEQEWEIAAQQLTKEPYDGNFLESRSYHPIVGKGNGVQHLLGNAWEWTSSAYLPYPGYKPYDGALGEYNGKFMMNQMVLRGGSCATPQNHIRASYRNFFQPETRWQFSGIRLSNAV